MIKQVMYMLFACAVAAAAGGEQAGGEAAGEWQRATPGDVPVVLLDGGLLDNVTRGSPAVFRRTERAELEGVLQAAVQLGATLVFFVEDALCIEDLSARDSKGTAYPNLARLLMAKKAKYFFSVQDAADSIERLFPARPPIVLPLPPGGAPPASPGYLHLQFAQEPDNPPRPALLRAHDRAMQSALEHIADKTRGPIVAVYTGRWNPAVFRRADELKKVQRGVRFERHEVWMRCGQAEFMFTDPMFKVGRELTRAVIVDCTGNDTQKTYELRFSVKPNGPVYRLWLRFAVEVFTEYLWNWATWAYDIPNSWDTKFRIINPIYYMNSTNHTLFEWHETNRYYFGNTFEYISKWTDVSYSRHLVPYSGHHDRTTLIINNFKMKLYSGGHRAAAPLGQEVRNICETIYSYYVQAQNLLVSPAIIMGLVVGALWLSWLTLALRMLLSIRSNDRYAPPGFAARLAPPDQDDNEDVVLTPR